MGVNRDADLKALNVGICGGREISVIFFTGGNHFRLFLFFRIAFAAPKWAVTEPLKMLGSISSPSNMPLLNTVCSVSSHPPVRTLLRLGRRTEGAVHAKTEGRTSPSGAPTSRNGR